MKHVIPILVLWVSPSWGTIALVQSSTGSYSAASSCALTINPTQAGSLLVGIIGLNAVATTDVTGVADNSTAHNTYTHNTSADATGTLKADEIWYAVNSSPGATTVTFSLSTPLTGDCFFYEFSGGKGASPLDVSNAVNSGTTGSPENGAALTPTNAGDVLVIGLMPETQVTSVGGSFTGKFGTNKGGVAYLLPASTAAQTPAFSGDSHVASNYCSAATAFLPNIGLIMNQIWRNGL